MPLTFDNPDDSTQPLFDRLQAAATGNLSSGRVRIDGSEDLFTAKVNEWSHTGSADEVVDAFKDWLATD